MALNKETLIEIREKLRAGVYRNEEHVRLSLVARILLELGWNIWDPREVDAEFKVAPSEDKTKVDIALFSNQSLPTVFVETKPPGGIVGRLQEIELQIRDYNRNNTALFSVITDGQEWRFYYSQTRGELRDKCFKVIEILKDDLEAAAVLFWAFLSKSEIEKGEAEKRAGEYLQSDRKKRAMEECLPKARRNTQETPFPTLTLS